MTSFTAIFLAMVSFIATFTAARMLRRWLAKRRLQKDEQEVARTQSRQVRRARARSRGARQ